MNIHDKDLMLSRVSFMDPDGRVFHQWALTDMLAADIAHKAAQRGMEAIQVVDVYIPWTESPDLAHWLNSTINNPYTFEDDMSINKEAYAADGGDFGRRLRAERDDAVEAAQRVLARQKGNDVAAQMAGVNVKPGAMEGDPVLVGSMAGPLDVQVGGSHYKDQKIQPVEYIHANGIPFIEGSVIKYVSRWRSKGGIKDLEKARHFIDILISLEERNVPAA